MPLNRDLSEEEERRFEEGGGVTEETKRDRERVFNDFLRYCETKLKKSIGEQIRDDREVLSKIFSDYFWTMRVELKVR